eukprot:TRINITY_DN5676_c0_g1_i1.p1 TRINITY_DN5676_c0_g1~~TRINITY_DN5676_c0_g1_i1.p1  ORF type:complete len:333 (-),score=115.56 TRINITY_DN5676_c0_g1_i1:84-1082(-)
MSAEDVSSLASMGFSVERCQQALAVTGNVQSALEWLLQHQDSSKSKPDPQISPPPSQTMTYQNPVFRCAICKITILDEKHATVHATKTKHTEFEEYIPEPGSVVPPPQVEEESQKPKLSEEEKRAQLEKLQQKIAERKLKKQDEDEKEKLEKEKQRRENQKQLEASKEKWKREKEQKEQEQQRREKLEAKIAHEKIKQKVEEDRLARKRQQEQTESSSTSSNTTPSTTATTNQPATTPATTPTTTSIPSSKQHDSCTLQIRLTNGSKLEAKFELNDTVGTVFDYVKKNRTDGSAPFTLLMTYPKKSFTESMRDVPLSSTELVPKAVLILTKQ